MKELIYLTLIVFLSSADAEKQGVYITQIWNGGFHGHFTLRPDHTLHGWEATLTLSVGVDRLDVSTT